MGTSRNPKKHEDKSVDRLAAVLERMAEGLLFVNGSSVISTMNSAAVRMLGPESKDWLGGGISEAHPEVYKALDIMADAFSHGQHQAIRGTIRLDGRTLEAHFSQVTDEGGGYGGLVVLFQDRTEETEFQTHMMHAEKLAVLGELAAAVAHEINNPLGGILEAISIIQDKSCDYEKVSKFLPLIEEGLHQIQRSVQRMLKFSERHVSEKRPVAIEEVLTQSVEFLSEHARREHATTIDLDMGSGKTLVWGDPHALSQVFVNLLNNALDALQADGPRKVWITLRHPDAAQVIVQVNDSGCGIRSEDRGRVFDPFFTTKPTGKGTGLGLSICANIVNEHAGTITHSPGSKGGTTFTVTLPTRQVTADKTLDRRSP